MYNRDSDLKRQRRRQERRHPKRRNFRVRIIAKCQLCDCLVMVIASHCRADKERDNKFAVLHQFSQAAQPLLPEPLGRHNIQMLARAGMPQSDGH